MVLESTVQNPHGTSGASEYLALVSELGDTVIAGQLNNYSGTSVLTKTGTIGVKIGSSFELQGTLQATAHAAAHADPLNQHYGSVGFMDASTLALNTGYFYFDLDPGIDATIVVRSGTSYATPVAGPALDIKLTGDQLLVSWLATADGCQFYIGSLSKLRIL